MTNPRAADNRKRQSSHRTGRNMFFCMVIFTCYLIISAISCGTKSDPADHPLSEDERYLIDTYTKIIRAQDLHSQNPAGAESLFAAIDSTTDTLRIANTITSINLTPERWLKIFEVLDTRQQRISKKPVN